MASSYRKLELEPVRVTLLLRQMEIEGNIHVEPGGSRFSDAWESFRRAHESRRFMPITDAVIRNSGGEPRKVGFIVVDREEVVAAYPVAV